MSRSSHSSVTASFNPTAATGESGSSFSSSSSRSSPQIAAGSITSLKSGSCPASSASYVESCSSPASSAPPSRAPSGGPTTRWGWASTKSVISRADSAMDGLGRSGSELEALNAASISGFWDGPAWEPEGDAWERDF